MVSQFNPLFNGEQSYLKGVETIENSHKNNYEGFMSVYKWADEKAAQTVIADMDRAIEKGSKVIRKHSMVIRGKQKNPRILDSYMLIGKARFYKRDLFPALETFNYVTQEFPKTDASYEAYIWAAKCQIQIGNAEGALVLLDEVYNNKKVDDGLNPDIHALRGMALVQKGNYEEAVEALDECLASGPSKEMKIRVKFLQGQVYTKMGLRHESSVAFGDAADLKPNDYEMYFKARLYRAKNFDVYMESSKKVYDELEDLLDDEKNKEYQDQIYYAMAEVALQEEEFKKAEIFLKKAIANSKANPEQKALAYLKIGDINFSFKDYVPAAAYYDSAVTTLPTSHPDYKKVQKLNNSLSRLVKNIEVVTLQDSLIMMAGLSPEAQKKKIEDYIDNQKELAEKKRRAQELKELNASLAAASAASTGPTAGGGTGWYFYNTSVRGNGQASFINVWGSRTLEDNWNLKSKGPQGAFGGPGSGDPETETQSAKPIASKGGPSNKVGLDLESMMAQIPNNSFALDTSHLLIQEALINQGQVYQLELKDNKEALKVYEDFMKRYPKTQNTPRVLFSMYRIYSVEKDEKNAQEVKNTMVNDFPESLYTKKITSPEALSASENEKLEIIRKYDDCYGSFSLGDYKKGISKIDNYLTNNTSEFLRAKFLLLKGHCFGKLGKTEEMLVVFNEIKNNYANSQEAALVNSILSQVDDPTAVASNEVFPFKFSETERHKYIIVFPNKGVNANQVRNGVADFNKSFFKFENLQVSNIFLDKARQILIVGTFQNLLKGSQYLESIRDNGKFWGNLPRNNIEIFIISESNLQVLYGSKDTEQYLRYYKLNYEKKK